MRILCATDLLAKSEAAVRRAGMLADQMGAELTLLHVRQPGDSRPLAHIKGHIEASGARSQTRPSVIVRTGDPARLIIDTLEESNSQLLILGQHARRPLRDALVGTIAEKVLMVKRRPLLVVQEEPLAAYERVLLALDASETSAGAVKASESLVVAPRTRMKVVHAHETPFTSMLDYAGVDADAIARYASDWERDAVSAVRALVRSASVDDERYEISVEQGQPVSAILRVVESYAPDLMVIGTRGRGRVGRALLGSVANRLLHELSCDALFVPEGSFEAPAERWRASGGLKRVPPKASTPQEALRRS